MIRVGSLMKGVYRIIEDRSGCGGGRTTRFPGLPSLPGAGGPDESLQTDEDVVCLAVEREDAALLLQQKGLSLGRADPGLDLVVLPAGEGRVCLLQEGAVAVNTLVHSPCLYNVSQGALIP